MHERTLSLDATVKNFIWGGKSSHWMNWNYVTQPMRSGGLVFIQLGTDISLLWKHVWDILQNQHKLWVQLLSSKYQQGSNILGASSLASASYTWNSILKTVTAIKSGKFRVGNGEVSVWYDKWLNDDYLCHLVPYVNIQGSHLQLKHIYSDSQWHWNRFATTIPTSVKLHLQSLFLDGCSDDVLIWGHSFSRSYYAKDAYQWLTLNQSNELSRLDSLAWFWGLQIPENIKHFLWLALHGCPPSNFFRTLRHILVMMHPVIGVVLLRTLLCTLFVIALLQLGFGKC